jgi:hypothetical protein
MFRINEAIPPSCNAVVLILHVCPDTEFMTETIQTCTMQETGAYDLIAVACGTAML